jgi:DDE superfamily endonuclease
VTNFLEQKGLCVTKLPNFGIYFVHSLTGWEGSATDAHVYEDAQEHDLHISPGKYYLADAGYPHCPELLVPYHNIRYHLAEWGRAHTRWGFVFFKIQSNSWHYNRPCNKEELFNLYHASAWNVIERIFGVLKRCFRILLIAPEYGLDIQAWIPSALCAIHNFNRKHDSPDSEAFPNDEDYFDDNNDTDNGSHLTDDAEEGNNKSMIQDQIAQEMWKDYLNVLHGQGLDFTDPLPKEDSSDDSNDL